MKKREVMTHYLYAPEGAAKGAVFLRDEALGAYSNIIFAIGCADSRQDVVFAYEKPSAADAAGKHIYGRSAEELRYEHIYGLVVNLLRPAYLLYHA